MSQQNTRPEALATSLAALPGAVVRPTEHAAKGYDLDVSLTPEALVPAVNILDAAGYFLETITGVDWLGEQAALRKAAEAAEAAEAKKREEALAKLRALLPGSAFAAQGRTAAKPYTEVLTAPVNEAFIIDGGVNYDILTWPMERQADRRVLARIMSYEYLWHNIREVGGAYGTGMLTRAQTEGLYTYRDPHLTESYETFAKAPEVLAGREYTEKDLTEFIVGAVSEMDSPKKPNAEAKELDRRYFCGITDAMLAADRKAMCSVTAETIRAQAADLADRMANATRVAFGSKDAVEAGKQLFDRIETL